MLRIIYGVSRASLSTFNAFVKALSCHDARFAHLLLRIGDKALQAILQLGLNAGGIDRGRRVVQGVTPLELRLAPPPLLPIGIT